MLANKNRFCKDKVKVSPKEKIIFLKFKEARHLKITDTELLMLQTSLTLASISMLKHCSSGKYSLP